MGGSRRCAMESRGCIVSAGWQRPSGGAECGAAALPAALPLAQRGCSGLLLDGQRGLVLCHGQPFLPFLQRQGVSDQPFLLPGAFHNDLAIQIHLPGHSPGGNAKPPRLSLAPSSALAPQLGSGAPSPEWAPAACPAEMLLVFHCPEFQDIFQTLFDKSDKWYFHSEDRGQEEVQTEPLDLLWFALLRCPGWAGDAHRGSALRAVRSERLRKGQSLFSCASPFSSFCPEIFMNTISKGIVSNLAGERNAMILTDARCLPGTEGGGIYVKSQDGYYLAGLIVAPLCWKANEWVGLTLVCSVSCILDAVRRILNGSDRSDKKVPFCPVSGHLPLANPGWQCLTRLLDAVALLQCGRVWGSGVIISPRLILTCRHVLGQASTVKVKIQLHSGSCLALTGTVLFATKKNSAYDVAVVELEEDLLAVETPAITSGFSTGIVSSNARNNNAGATYPHLNFSFPITVLRPLLSVYNQARDASAFEGLNKVSDRLRAVWRFQDTLSAPQKSKL
ncbi:peroxisomal leader peptide-processing protease isoform X2 [Scyliorhinus torazame]|uniref:peroxisomal leader peptide-processing protease isoform X2 n=1 Tax=Scyliorhinus torazame TaxID=75743 RepID=UPI003B5920B1